jgi:hypothetical protein
MGIYIRYAAVRYATKWALSRNPAYKNFSAAAGGGGDCSNFVSQCLAAGGWQMIPGGKRDADAWYCDDNDGDNSNTWSSAQWLYWFLDRSPRTTALDDKDDLALGDIVMLQGPGFSHPDHAMMVTWITGVCTPEGERKQICLSYHSTDKLNNPLDEIESRYGEDTKYYYFHINDLFADVDPGARITRNWHSL